MNLLLAGISERLQPAAHIHMHLRRQTHALMQAQSDERLPGGWRRWRWFGRGVNRSETDRATTTTPPALCRPVSIAAYSLAAMKLMWGLARGNRGRLLLNSVMSWTNVGWKRKRKRGIRIIEPHLRSTVHGSNFERWANISYLWLCKWCMLWVVL